MEKDLDLKDLEKSGFRPPKIQTSTTIPYEYYRLMKENNLKTNKLLKFAIDFFLAEICIDQDYPKCKIIDRYENHILKLNQIIQEKNKEIENLKNGLSNNDLS
jgi:hypothetical protein